MSNVLFYIGELLIYSIYIYFFPCSSAVNNRHPSSNNNNRGPDHTSSPWQHASPLQRADEPPQNR
jgi:hypothetical protein